MSDREYDVPVEGGSLHVGEWGPEDGAAVVAVHGITASHRAWSAVAAAMPELRIIAPDLRGRGRSNALPKHYGMVQHAADLARMMDAAGLASAPIVGHSMGGFVALVASQLTPERFPHLLLVDGGLPLALPDGMTVEAQVAATLGPAAARLSMAFPSADAYLEFWRQHPAFVGAWNDDVEQYALYDLQGDAPELRASTTLEAVAEDSAELYGSDEIWNSIESVREFVMLTAPRGLLDETPGLYSPQAIERWKKELPLATITEVPDTNHYTIVMSERGAGVIATRVRAMVGA